MINTYIKNFYIIPNLGKGIAWDMVQALEYCFINDTLFNFHLLGFATILDTNNWMEKILIDSNCLVSIKIQAEDGITDLLFRVTGITDIEKEDDHRKRYNIQFVSEEAIKNFTVRINKGYAGTSTAIVTDILSNITKKSIIISKSKDEAHILGVNVHPYKLIDQLNLYGSKECYDFLFWENIRGLNYNRISEMLARPILHKIYEKDLELVTEEDIFKNPEYFNDKNNILDYYKGDNENFVKSVREGIQGSTVYTFNSLNGMPYKYEVGQDYKKSIIYQYNDDTLYYQNYASRHSILNQIIDDEFMVSTIGDINRCTGDMCYVEINGASKDPQYTSTLSGNFLILRIEHEFTIEGYKQVIGLTR